MSRFSRPAWLTTGLIIGAITVPAVSVAATATYVSISANGRVAAVSPYGQLRTTEVDPGYTIHKYQTVSGCTDLGVLSSNRAVVVKQFNAGLYGSSQPYSQVYLRTGNCFGPIIAEQDHSTLDTISTPLGNGVSIPAGAHLWAGGSNGALFDVDVYGYQAVPGAMPPATAAQMLRNAGPTTNATAVKKR